jgi:hypothetical protein
MVKEFTFLFSYGILVFRLYPWIYFNSLEIEFVTI